MQDGWGNNPLIGACQEGNAETAQILLDHGAIADYKNKVYILSLKFRHGYVMLIIYNNNKL